MTVHDFDRTILVTYIYKLSLDILVFLVFESVLQRTIGCGTQDFIFCFYKVHSPMNKNIRKLFYFCFFKGFLCKTQHNNNKTKYSYFFFFLRTIKTKMVKYLVFNLITLLERRFRVKQCSFIEKNTFLNKKDTRKSR